MAAHGAHAGQAPQKLPALEPRSFDTSVSNVLHRSLPGSDPRSSASTLMPRSASEGSVRSPQSWAKPKPGRRGQKKLAFEAPQPWLHENPQGQFRAFSTSWPGQFNKHSILMVDAGSPFGPQRGSAVRVLFNLTPWKEELQHRRAYLVAYDVERLQNMARAMGLDSRTASTRWMSRDCLCSGMVKLAGYSDEVEIDLSQLAAAGGHVALLRVVLIGNRDDFTDWSVIGDPLVVRLTGRKETQLQLTDQACQKDESLEDLLQRLVQTPGWAKSLVQYLSDEALKEVLPLLRTQLEARSIRDEHLEALQERCNSADDDLKKLSLKASEDLEIMRSASQRDLERKSEELRRKEAQLEAERLRQAADLEAERLGKEAALAEERRRAEEAERRRLEESSLSDSALAQLAAERARAAQIAEEADAERRRALGEERRHRQEQLRAEAEMQERRKRQLEAEEREREAEERQRMAEAEAEAEAYRKHLRDVERRRKIQRTRLRVHIDNATDLRAADSMMMGGKSDPYVRCALKERAGSFFSTDVVPKNLNPVWKQEHIFDATNLSDILEFTVYDHDKGKKEGDKLGHYELHPDQFRSTGTFDGTLMLKDCGKKHKSTLVVKVEVLPLLYETAGDRLFVKVVSALGLRAAGRYCSVTIPGKPLAKFQTKYVKKTLEPHWNEEAEVVDFEYGDLLLFEVFEQNSMKKDVCLGRKRLKPSEFADGFRGTLALEDAGNTTARLNVVIDVL